jgi:hypothetical protein
MNSEELPFSEMILTGHARKSGQHPYPNLALTLVGGEFHPVMRGWSIYVQFLDVPKEFVGVRAVTLNHPSIGGHAIHSWWALPMTYPQYVSQKWQNEEMSAPAFLLSVLALEGKPLRALEK